jgi:heme exporter protein A
MQTDVMSFSAGSQAAHRSAQAQTGVKSVPFEAVGLECIRGDRLLFSDLSLSLIPGTLLQVEGLNGCGKTSLLRILCGLALPSQGEVRWHGQAIRKVRPEFMAEVAYIGHNHGIKGDLTPVENLRIACGLGRPSSINTIEAALHCVGLGDFSNVPARTLSAGQRRRVALGRLLATRAQLWVLDEPLASLDIKGTAMMEEILSEHLLQGGMAVVTTHQPLSMAPGQLSRLELG